MLSTAILCILTALSTQLVQSSSYRRGEKIVKVLNPSLVQYRARLYDIDGLRERYDAAIVSEPDTKVCLKKSLDAKKLLGYSSNIGGSEYFSLQLSNNDVILLQINSSTNTYILKNRMSFEEYKVPLFAVHYVTDKQKPVAHHRVYFHIEDDETLLFVDSHSSTGQEEEGSISIMRLPKRYFNMEHRTATIPLGAKASNCHYFVPKKVLTPASNLEILCLTSPDSVLREYLLDFRYQGTGLWKYSVGQAYFDFDSLGYFGGFSIENAGMVVVGGYFRRGGLYWRMLSCNVGRDYVVRQCKAIQERYISMNETFLMHTVRIGHQLHRMDKNHSGVVNMTMVYKLTEFDGFAYFSVNSEYGYTVNNPEGLLVWNFEAKHHKEKNYIPMRLTPYNIYEESHKILYLMDSRQDPPTLALAETITYTRRIGNKKYYHYIPDLLEIFPSQSAEGSYPFGGTTTSQCLITIGLSSFDYLKLDTSKMKVGQTNITVEWWEDAGFEEWEYHKQIIGIVVKEEGDENGEDLEKFFDEIEENAEIENFEENVVAEKNEVSEENFRENGSEKAEQIDKENFEKVGHEVKQVQKEMEEEVQEFTEDIDWVVQQDDSIRTDICTIFDKDDELSHDSITNISEQPPTQEPVQGEPQQPAEAQILPKPLSKGCAGEHYLEINETTLEKIKENENVLSNNTLVLKLLVINSSRITTSRYSSLFPLQSTQEELSNPILENKSEEENVINRVEEVEKNKIEDSASEVRNKDDFDVAKLDSVNETKVPQEPLQNATQNNTSTEPKPTPAESLPKTTSSPKITPPKAKKSVLLSRQIISNKTNSTSAQEYTLICSNKLIRATLDRSTDMLTFISVETEEIVKEYYIGGSGGIHRPINLQNAGSVSLTGTIIFVHTNTDLLLFSCPTTTITLLYRLELISPYGHLNRLDYYCVNDDEKMLIVGGIGWGSARYSLVHSRPALMEYSTGIRTDWCGENLKVKYLKPKVQQQQKENKEQKEKKQQKENREDKEKKVLTEPIQTPIPTIPQETPQPLLPSQTTPLPPQRTQKRPSPIVKYLSDRFKFCKISQIPPQKLLPEQKSQFSPPKSSSEIENLPIYHVQIKLNKTAYFDEKLGFLPFEMVDDNSCAEPLSPAAAEKGWTKYALSSSGLPIVTFGKDNIAPGPFLWAEPKKPEVLYEGVNLQNRFTYSKDWQLDVHVVDWSPHYTLAYREYTVEVQERNESGEVNNETIANELAEEEIQKPKDFNEKVNSLQTSLYPQLEIQRAPWSVPLHNTTAARILTSGDNWVIVQQRYHSIPSTPHPSIQPLFQSIHCSVDSTILYRLFRGKGGQCDQSDRRYGEAVVLYQDFESPIELVKLEKRGLKVRAIKIWEGYAIGVLEPSTGDLNIYYAHVDSQPTLIFSEKLVKVFTLSNQNSTLICLWTSTESRIHGRTVSKDYKQHSVSLSSTSDLVEAPLTVVTCEEANLNRCVAAGRDIYLLRLEEETSGGFSLQTIMVGRGIFGWIPEHFVGFTKEGFVLQGKAVIDSDVVVPIIKEKNITDDKNTTIDLTSEQTNNTNTLEENNTINENATTEHNTLDEITAITDIITINVTIEDRNNSAGTPSSENPENPTLLTDGMPKISPLTTSKSTYPVLLYFHIPLPELITKPLYTSGALSSHLLNTLGVDLHNSRYYIYNESELLVLCPNGTIKQFDISTPLIAGMLLNNLS